MSFRTIINLVHLVVILIHLLIMGQWVNLSVFHHSGLLQGLTLRYHSYTHCYFENYPTLYLTHHLIRYHLPYQQLSLLHYLLGRSVLLAARSYGR